MIHGGGSSKVHKLATPTWKVTWAYLWVLVKVEHIHHHVNRSSTWKVQLKPSWWQFKMQWHRYYGQGIFCQHKVCLYKLLQSTRTTWVQSCYQIMVETVASISNRCLLLFYNRSNQNGEAKVSYCPTENMLMDFFTKPLQGAAFRIMCAHILNLPLDDKVTKVHRSVLEKAKNDGTQIKSHDKTRGEKCRQE